MLVQIDQDSLEKAFSETLKKDIVNIKEIIDNNMNTNKGSGTFSWDHDEDTEKLIELLSSLKITLDWYSLSE